MISSDKNSKYILLVDDAKDIVYTFDVYLKAIRYSTVSFVNPIEALDYFNKNFSNCILVITDYGMPSDTFI